MSVNVELLEQVMQHITDHPKQHVQSTWISECGTAACFAGWAVKLSPELEEFQCSDDECGAVRLVRDGDGNEYTVAEAAEKFLGLTEDEADYLFYASNNRDVLALMVKDLVNGDHLRAPFYYKREARR